MHFFPSLLKPKAHSGVGSQITPDAYWSLPAERLLVRLGSDANDLTERKACARLKAHGPNAVGATERTTALFLFFHQFRSPLVLILMVASIIWMLTGEWVDAAVVLTIVLGSTILGFGQEYIAGKAIGKLHSKVSIISTSCAVVALPAS